MTILQFQKDKVPAEPSGEMRHAVEKAEKIQSALDAEHPSFVKPMLRSPVTGGFWLGLPAEFCRTYLPKDDDQMMTLIDEDGNPFQIKYHAGKGGLSGGWKRFAIDHELAAGDALVFQLVRPTEFKVRIVKANEPQRDSEKKKNRVSPGSFNKMKQDGVNDSPAESQSYKRKRKATVTKSLNDIGHCVMDDVMRKAIEIEANLKRDDPTLITSIKLMARTNLAPRFRLRLAKEFCEEHMPVRDRTIGLKGENGKVFPVHYFRRRRAIGGGWRAFAIHHELKFGDALVFQLIPEFKFQVHIVRTNASEEVDDQSLLKSDQAVKHEAGPLLVKENNETINVDDDDDDDDDGGGGDGWSELDNGFENGNDSKTKAEESVASDFEQVKCFDDFKIVANGGVIDDELSEPLRFKYYELCRSQSSFLHQHLLEGLDFRMVVGMIADTVNIADCIIAASSKAGSVGRDKDFETWESKLKGFDSLGMNVGFMLVRLSKIVHLAEKASKYEKLTAERAAAKEELQNLAMRVGKAGERVEMLDAEIEKLGLGGSGGGGIDHGFEELANAPW